MHVYLEAMGCRLNTAEIENLARRFAGAGYDVVRSAAEADIIVLNSCVVTAQATRKSRYRLRTLQRLAPTARFALTGCWATEDPDGVLSIPGVTWVIPNADKQRTVEIVGGELATPSSSPWAPGRWGRTRAFLGVQDGCAYACTYCITRILRGAARSQPLEDVLREVQMLVDHGAQEVVLTGVSLGAYGKDLSDQLSLAALVEAIFAHTAVSRLRLSSIEPWNVDARLLNLWSDSRLCRQLHLPLQSGSDAVLKRMGRAISTEHFAELVALARDIVPDIAITTDIIVGFPGETEVDFAASLDFVTRMAFARSHVFPYSERPGTPAVRLSGGLPKVLRRARAAEMRALGEHLRRVYAEQFVGQTLPVLWEPRDANGYWHGLTDNYLEVLAYLDVDVYNRVLPARLLKLEDTGTFVADILLT